MSEWSLPTIFNGIHDDIQNRLAIARSAIKHPGTKGDASENIWIELFSQYLPKRYSVTSAHIADSDNRFSDQMDVVIFDRQYTPFILTFGGQSVIPAESVYAVFEAKQAINAGNIRYAQNKIATVRRLRRTSLPIPWAAGGKPLKPRDPPHIIGGFLSLDSGWSSGLGSNMTEALAHDLVDGRLDLGCVAAHGYFEFDLASGSYQVVPRGKPTTAFLFRLISHLQTCATVPMVDVSAYARWLDDSSALREGG